MATSVAVFEASNAVTTTAGVLVSGAAGALVPGGSSTTLGLIMARHYA